MYTGSFHAANARNTAMSGHMHLIIVHLFARGFYPLTFLKGAISHS